MNAIETWLAQPESMEQLRQHAPDGFSPDSAKRAVLALLHNDEIQGGRLGQCSPRSLVLAVVQASALGLELGTGDAYVIPYKREATLSIGFRGMIRLAKQSGEVIHLKAEVVYESEEFGVSMSNGVETVTHELNFPRSEEEVKAVYCRAVCHDGYVDHEVMDRAEIESVKAASMAKMGGKTSPAWKQWYGEMAKKSVIRRMLKRYTLSPEIEKVFSHEDRVIFTAAEVVRTSGADLNQRLHLTTDFAPMTALPLPEDATDTADEKDADHG